jgi:hypothetical protein
MGQQLMAHSLHLGLRLGLFLMYSCFLELTRRPSRHDRHRSKALLRGSSGRHVHIQLDYLYSLFFE